ncbi:MAG: type IV secretory system conjugative DNA transfer family protein, partial [Limisphaerales bacterium]
HIPSWRARHVVYFNPSDLEYPIGINPLADVPPDKRHLVVSGLVEAFQSIWRDSWGPRLQYILTNALAALIDCPNATLLGVSRLLTDPSYRAFVMRHVRDPFIKKFWLEEFERYNERLQSEAISPVLNKVGQFLMNPPMRNILGQPKSKIDFRFIMDDQRIFIANLAKGKLGADKVNLLGSLLTTQFHLAAMSRSEIPEHERTDYFLCIDEFQNFTTDTFASILSEARKFRFCLTLSHQYIDQLSLEIQKAVFGNVGTMVSFQVGYTDAEILEKEFSKTFTAEQFTDLNRHEIFVKLLVDGVGTTPFRAATLAPLTTEHFHRANLIARSRERFSQPRHVVENKINRWIAGAGDFG